MALDHANELAVLADDARSNAFNMHAAGTQHEMLRKRVADLSAQLSSEEEMCEEDMQQSRDDMAVAHKRQKLLPLSEDEKHRRKELKRMKRERRREEAERQAGRKELVIRREFTTAA